MAVMRLGALRKTFLLACGSEKNFLLIFAGKEYIIIRDIIIDYEHTVHKGCVSLCGKSVKMAKYRQGKINDAVMQAMSEAVREIKDPRVSSAMVTITAAEVTPDLKYAKIYFSAILGEKSEVKKGLVSASGFLRRTLSQTLNLRITPELTFCEDKSIEHGAHIAKLLNNIEITAQDNGEDDGEAD